MMHGEDIARTIVGVVGNIISGLLFLSPCPTFWRICKKKTTEEFHPYPYLITVMNCMLWIFYGLPVVHPDSTLVITINSAGLFLEICYLTIFFIYTSNKNRGIIVTFLLGECALVGGIAAITLLLFHTTVKRSMFVGIICVVVGVVMYGSPLSILRKVIKTKSVEYLPFWLCLAGFANGIIWFIYANLKSFDPYIASGNGIGAILGLIQLSMYAYYTYKKRREGGKDTKAGDVQLQDVSANIPPV